MISISEAETFEHFLTDDHLFYCHFEMWLIQIKFDLIQHFNFILTGNQFLF